MAKKIIKIERSVHGLRDLLFTELEHFRAGNSSIKRAQTIINFSREIIAASRLEIVQSALLLEATKNGSNKTLLLK